MSTAASLVTVAATFFGVFGLGVLCMYCIHRESNR